MVTRKATFIRSLTKSILAAALLALAAVSPARAQFLGYIANQSTQQNVFSAASCSSTLNSALLSNIGQVGHAVYYSITSGGANVQVAIQASANNANWFQISNNAPTQPNIITGTGAYPYLRVQVTGGGAGCTITANYSGSSVATTVSLTGSNAQFMYLFTPFSGAAAGTTANSANISAPYGNAAGYLVVSYLGGAGPSGSTLAIEAIDGPTGTTNAVASYTLATASATAQVFPVPGYAGNTFYLAYTSGGTSTATFTVSYYFTYPGQGPANSSSPAYVNIVGPNPLPVSFSSAVSDPCQSSGAAKLSAPISISTATTTQLVALSSGKVIFPCSIALEASAAGGTLTAQFEYGTSASCSSGAANLTGVMTFNNQTEPFEPAGGFTIWSIPASDALCVVTTGTFTSLSGYLTYVQQ